MSSNDIREPIQKRSIEKKEKIIKTGFELICKNGYYNTNTQEIAKKAGVSTGIIYQYFKDKHDIFIAGLQKYADKIFYQMLNIEVKTFRQQDFPTILRNMIEQYSKEHKLSESAHQEIMAMTHLDKDVSHYFYQREMDMTIEISYLLQSNGYLCDNLIEKVHIMIGMIDNLCHEIVYHKHDNINYNTMTDLVIESIIKILK